MRARRYNHVSWDERRAPPPIDQARTDRFAELLAEGYRMRDAQAAMGLTKGEAASTMRRIKTDLGWDQAR
jgi:hypothetical protein